MAETKFRIITQLDKRVELQTCNDVDDEFITWAVYRSDGRCVALAHNDCAQRATRSHMAILEMIEYMTEVNDG